MAGKGSRFTDAGYTQNKALIPVSGEPMIVQAAKSMPKANKWVFVVKQEHLLETDVINALKSVGDDVAIVVDPDPQGQLKSCLVAKNHYDNDEPIFIGACDLGMVWDAEKYLTTLNSGADVISWSFTQQPNLTRNPHAWGWLQQDENMIIKNVSVKIPISNNPFNDHAITGSFTFKSGKFFLQMAEELMKRNITVKGEFYIDSMLQMAIDLGYQVKSFPVKYIGWGVPADYEEYCQWEKVIPNINQFPEYKEKPEFTFWNDYFTKDLKNVT